MSQSPALTVPLYPDAGLPSYIRAVNALPVHTAEQERQLALRFRRHNDLDAARELVLANLRHVVRIARGFTGYGLPQADLIQEGNIGLMKAVKHFDPDRKVRLMSFAVHWIKAEIYDYILRNWRIVKIATTKAQRKLFFNLRKTRERLGWMTNSEVARLSDELNVAPGTVREMEGRMANTDVAFDGDASDDDDARVAPAEYLPDMRYNPEVLVTRTDQEGNREDQLKSALATLDSRSREIIRRRWLSEEKPTLHELAREYGVSAERIRQIEARALTKMRNSLAA